MSTTLKSFTAVLAVAIMYLGFSFSAIDEPQTSSLFNLPETETTSDTSSASSEEGTASSPVMALQAFNDAIVDITERTNPTVVTITTQQTVRQQMRSPFSFFFDDPRFDREREFQREGLGSGVIVSEEGYIITNNHVIDNADEIRVKTFDGDELDAEVVGTDPGSDVAVLRVDPSGLRAITMGDSDQLRVGELVLAIGSPLRAEFAHTVSMGVVSAKGRADIGLSPYENYIQTDAAINPGNSGGPLINMDGHLIGINTAIASRSGGSQGIGFAIPSNLVRSVMESIIEDGRVVRSFLGIQQGAMVDRTMARALDLDVNFGVVIGEVVADGPADKAGLREGDVLLEKDGEPIRDWAQFRFGIANSAPGTEIEFKVFRDGERMTLNVELEEMPEDEAVAAVPDDEKENLREELGFTVDELNENIRRQLRLSENIQGVVVADINRGSRAFRQGLRQGDVITQLQNQPVTNSEEFYSVVSGLISASQEVMLMRVNRQGNNIFVAVEL